MPDDLLRRLFPRRADEPIDDPQEAAAVQQEASVEAWADLHEHPTVPIVVFHEREELAGRYCRPCGVVRTARPTTPPYEPQRAFLGTWIVWRDVAWVAACALLWAWFSLRR